VKYEFFGRGSYIVASALVTIILARLLDPDDYGLMFLAISILGIIKLFSRLGIAKSTAKYITTFKERDPMQIPHILRFGFRLNMALLIVTCLTLLFIYEHVAVLIGEQELAPFLFIGILYVAFSTLDYFARRALQGFESIEITAFTKSVRGVLKLVLSVGFVLLNFGALGAFVGYLLAHGVAATIGLTYLYVRYYRGAEQGQIENGLRRRIGEYSLPITATSTAGTIERYFDTVMVGFFIGPTAVAFYTVGKQVIGFIETPAKSLGFTLAPTYEAQKAQGNIETTARIFEEGVSYTLLLYIPAAAGLILVSEPLIELVFGDQYLGAVPVLQILTIYAVFHSIDKLVGSGLDFLGRARERAIARTGSAGLNVVLNLALIPMIGVVGAAIATVITYGLYTLANLYILSTEIELRYRYLSERLFATVAVTGVMSAIVYMFVDNISGFPTLFVIIGLGIIIWGSLATLFGLLDIQRVISAIT